MKRPFKIWSADRKVRKCVMAETLKEIISKGSEKMALADPVTVVLECDGTEVDDEDYFQCLPVETCFLLLTEGQTWKQQGLNEKSEDEADSALPATGDVNSILEQLRYNMTVLVTLSNQQLQMLIEADTALIATALSDTHVSAATLQDTCQRYLDDRSMAVEAMDLLRHCNRGICRMETKEPHIQSLTPNINGVVFTDGNKFGDEIEKLLEACHKAKKSAYCPYSHFPVGAALLCTDGTIVTGCNVENAAYPLGNCAEKTAICKAVSEGHRKFKAVAISSNLESEYITPCGSCRQVLAEFGIDWDVYMTKVDRSVRKTTVRELLPLSFTPQSLLEGQEKYAVS